MNSHCATIFDRRLPAFMVQCLSELLPAEYTAEPRVHVGALFEMDVCVFDTRDAPEPTWAASAQSGGVATAVTTTEPTLVLNADLAEQYEYAVHIYDQEHGRKLVAAVEIVSPGNKDRPASRRAFVARCAALLQQGVCEAAYEETCRILGIP